jgi:CelD/BcsL family acetyltransferase involved in cellulose biosynthesis
MNVAYRDTVGDPMPEVKPRRRSGPMPILTLCRDIEAARDPWLALAESDSISSPYQAFDWIRLWHEHVSAPLGQEPLIVIGHDDRGAPLFVWPLLERKLGPLRVATFFGGKHATLNMPLWRRDIASHFSASDMKAAMSALAAQAPDIDLMMLHSHPATWDGTPNPFMQLPHQLASEDNFVLHISASADSILAEQISGTMRSRLRNKERKLAKLPGYRYLRAHSAADVDRQLNAFFAQKAEKLQTQGIENAFGQTGVEDFIRAACHEGLSEGRPVIELYALETDNDMLALFSGIHDGQRFTSMFNSHTATEAARYSPGLILLQHLIVDCARRSFRSFDIGPGEARYKTFFCKDIELIYDSILPLSARGHATVPLLRSWVWAKGHIKRNPRLWGYAHAIRARLVGGK